MASTETKKTLKERFEAEYDGMSDISINSALEAVKEWLEQKKQYFQTSDSMVHYELFVRGQIQKFIDDLIKEVET